MRQSGAKLPTGTTDAADSQPAEIDGYRVLEQLGRGGMAVVYRVADPVRKREVALKQLLPRDVDARTQRAPKDLFAREYHTLSELSHPAIVEVYDYGALGDRPYYTMELLGGGDLHTLAPLPWRQAAAVLCDVCSALSLIHSRRYVYRDLSPRNVRCDQDGRGKLIDLGAIAKMGTAPSPVCTPAVAAPEVIRLQPLDGRTDLFALGATLFFALTGKHPFPARSFVQLEQLWRRCPAPPSAYVEGIPEGLDRLVLELIQLDPSHRPANTTEVSQRLAALANVPLDATRLVSQAYLTTPTLVGRETELEAIRRRFARSRDRAQGCAVVIRGAAGVGRSRMLDACVLDAKLTGLSVLRARAADAPPSAFGIVHVWVQQWILMDVEHLLASAGSDFDLLAALLPDLHALRPQAPIPELSAKWLKTEAVQVLIWWLARAAREAPLLLAIDDADQLDLESQALIALLAHSIEDARLILLGSTTTAASDHNDALRLLERVSHTVDLRPLTEEQTGVLLESVFGDVPNLRALAKRLYQVTRGNPSDLMQVCQHLLDTDVVRCNVGSWVIPERIDRRNLPASMAQALSAIVARLDQDSQTVAWGLAVDANQTLDIDECARMVPELGPSRLATALDTLMRLDVVREAGCGYELARNAFQPALAQTVPETEQRRLLSHLAEVFASRGDGVRAARCLFRAGEDVRGLELLIEHAARSSAVTNRNLAAFVKLIAGLPDAWMDVYRDGLVLCEQLGRPPRDYHVLRIRLLGMASAIGLNPGDPLVDHLQALAAAAGLDLYAQMDDALPENERMLRALKLAAKRHAEAPENERLFPPQEALTLLAQAIVAAMGGIGNTLDVAQWRRVPRISPLAFLSPALALIARLQDGFEARLTGRFETARRIYIELLESLEQKDIQLEPTYRSSMRSGLGLVLAMIEGGLGISTCEARLDLVEGTALRDFTKLTVRAVAHMFQGDARGADELDRQREVRGVEHPSSAPYAALHLLWRAQAHAIANDLTRLRQDLEAIEREAQQIPTWQPVLAWARGQFERARGDCDAALAHLDDALANMPAFGHQLWVPAVGAKVATLCDAARFDEARSLGQAMVTGAESAGIGVQAALIRMPLALATARLGEGSEARALAQRCVEDYTALGVTGLNLGQAYETVARVAGIAGDTPAFEAAAELCSVEYTRHRNAALASKVRRLWRDHGRLAPDLPGGARMAASISKTTTSISELRSVMAACSDASARLDGGLWLLVRAARADGAFLFTRGEGQLKERARVGETPLDGGVEDLAGNFLDEVLGHDVTQTGAANSDPATPTLSLQVGEHFFHPLLLSHGADGALAITGCVIIATREATIGVDPELASSISLALCNAGDLDSTVMS